MQGGYVVNNACSRSVTQDQDSKQE